MAKVDALVITVPASVKSHDSTDIEVSYSTLLNKSTYPNKCTYLYVFKYEPTLQSRTGPEHTANIFEVIFTVFNCVLISTVISLYCLHLIAAPSTVK
jgi:KaiC/GvpD/RAD55 family RecA-like ATPase